MEVELHNVWITKMTLVSGQGKPGHMQFHKLLSGGKARGKRKGILSVFQPNQCSNRPIATKLFFLSGLSL